MKEPRIPVIEKAGEFLIGKNWVYFIDGQAIASGYVATLLNATTMVLYVDPPNDEDPPVEIHCPMNMSGYDWTSKTGYQFSVKNPRKD
jgi:hypothetical protein